MKKKVLHMLILMCVMLMTASAALAHECDFRPWVTKRNPTCKQTGLKFRYCKSCDHWEKKEIEKLPHTLGEWTVTQEPTCARKGMKEAYCSECGDRVRRYIDLLEHEYGEMTVTTQPKCRNTGKGQYVCIGCGKKKYETIDSLGHDWSLVSATKEASCKAAGSGKFKCTRCGREETRKIDKLEHDWNEWTIIQNPDGQKKGTRESTCKLCGLENKERFYWEGTLYQDMEANEDVIRLQEMLRDLGYYGGNIRSGAFGALTGKAVAEFQKDHGMKGTQVADPDTRALIESEWQKKMGIEATETL